MTNKLKLEQPRGSLKTIKKAMRNNCKNIC